MGLRLFLSKVKALSETVKCRSLMVIRERDEKQIRRIQSTDVNTMLKQRFKRIHPISALEATQLLCEQSRHLYNWEFHGLPHLQRVPSTHTEMSECELFQWLSRSPVLIQRTAEVLAWRVPFSVIVRQMSVAPNAWKDALNEWREKLFNLSEDAIKDALSALRGLLTEINCVKAIWAERAEEEEEEEEEEDE